MQSEISNLFGNSEESDLKKKIVDTLINTENLEGKTQLNKPLKWSILKTIEEFLLSHNLPKSNAILKNWMETSFIYLISDNRKGRQEIIEALKSLTNVEHTIQPTIGANQLQKQ